MKNFKKNKAFVKPSGAKQSKFFIHVAQGKIINNVVVNNAKTPVNKGFAEVFNFLQIFNILEKRHFRYDLDTIF